MIVLYVVQRVLFTVIAINPYNAEFGKVTDAWGKVAQNSGLEINAVGAKNRIDLITKARKKEDAANRRKSGVEEEYTEREILLDEVITLADEAEVCVMFSVYFF